MYLREAREAEKYVDDVGGQFGRFSPIFAQDPRQRAQQSFILRQFLQIIRRPRKLKN